MKIISTLVLLLVAFSPLYSQNVKVLEEGKKPKKASIEDVSWIAGHWKGEMEGSTIEEIWTQPMAGAMMGSFRMANDEKVIFYELMTISKYGNSLLLRIKHFNANLTGWEEKEESVEFPLVDVDDEEETAAYFSGLTFKQVSADQMDIYVHQEAGETMHEVKFTYKRK